MFKRLWSWLNERWPASAVIRGGLAEDIPGGPSYFYSFGSSVLFVFVLQAFTGVFQLFYYVPTVDHAYVSLSFLRLEVPFGWLIHNLHFWGATAMVVLVVVHMTRVYLWGAYKKPREMTWLLGVILFLLTMSLMFTGSPLPWDEKGYWATEVGTSIAGTVPLVGGFVKNVLRGTESMGQLTISRFFVLHAVLLSGLAAVFILLHIVAVRKAGSAGPWDESKRVPHGPFWPDQVHKDLVTALVVFFVLMALAAFVPPAFTGPADPLDAFYVPKAEWSFLFLYQALKYFPGPLEAVGTVGVPLVLILLLVSVPFIDRRPERNPAKRPLALGLYFAILAGIVALSIAGTSSRPGAASGPASPGRMAVDEAKLYFSLGCSGCHSINGVGGKMGPDLAMVKARNRSPEWIAEQIRNPGSHDPKTSMPAFGKLSRAQALGLADYLLSLSTGKGGAPASPTGRETAEPGASGDLSAGAPPAVDRSPETAETPAPNFVGNAGHGGLLFGQFCQRCHGLLGKGGIPNPGSDDGTVPPLNPIDRELFDAVPRKFAVKIDPFIQHGSTPPGPRPTLRMPAFGDANTLTQEQISNLEAYILGLNNVSRAEASHPGLAPATLFGLVAAVFIVGCLGLGAGWMARKSRDKKRTP
jgi:ubiquinol-cytochrome c reductase cytochrome b subunit